MAILGLLVLFLAYRFRLKYSLQEKAHKKLTQLDLKYCAYLSLKLSAKRIAQLMSVEPKSVRMAKYRLKQKLNLTKEENLNDFLQYNEK